jgi:hypothetical protein
MRQFAFERRPDSSASIFDIDKGRQYIRQREGDGSLRWLRRTTNGFRPVSDRRARRLERIYRHRDEHRRVRRYPRLVWERKAGQPVFSPAFGFGRIIAIPGNKIVVKFGKLDRVVNEEDLLTRAQAEADWHLYWLRGERRRLQEGRRLSVIKSLCRHGEWKAFLTKYDYPRSTADDLINRYQNELRWEASEMPGNRANGHGQLGRPVNERQSNPDDVERDDLVKKEAKKRQGREPSHHKTLWSIRIKLPPEILTLCRERYRRKGERAKEFWRLAAYLFVRVEPPFRTHHKSHRHHENGRAGS